MPCLNMSDPIKTPPENLSSDGEPIFPCLSGRQVWGKFLP